MRMLDYYTAVLVTTLDLVASKDSVIVPDRRVTNKVAVTHRGGKLSANE